MDVVVHPTQPTKGELERDDDDEHNRRAVLAAVIAAFVGFSLSVPLDLPSGPAISAVSGVLAMMAWGVRRLQGAR